MTSSIGATLRQHLHGENLGVYARGAKHAAEALAFRLPALMAHMQAISILGEGVYRGTTATLKAMGWKTPKWIKNVSKHPVAENLTIRPFRPYKENVGNATVDRNTLKDLGIKFVYSLGTGIILNLTAEVLFGPPPAHLYNKVFEKMLSPFRLSGQPIFG